MCDRTILLVEDDAAHAEAIRRAFDAAGGAELQVARTLREFRAAMETAVPEIAILDLNLPDGRALEVLSAPAELGPFPILIMTSFGDEQVAVQALKAGALDYLVKSPETFRSLPHLVERALREWGLLQARRRAEAELRRSAERWQSTFDAIADIVCVVSQDHRLVEINEAGCRAAGRPREELIGRRCYEIAHGTSAPIPECPCRGVAPSGQRKSRLEQEGQTLEVAAWPILDEGQPAGFVHIVKDVSAEVAARREKDRLEEQLRLSQRLEAIGHLAGGVAHDFNNILSVILNNAGFVLEAMPESDPARADVLEIETAARRAAELTRQLLAFSRRQILEPQPLSLNATVTAFQGMLGRLLGEDIELALGLAADAGTVLADPGKIEQVIMNLAVNARDAMPQGGRLTLETANVDLDGAYQEQHAAVAAGRYVMLAVSDTGTGMDAETRAHVFEPFFTTKEAGKGTGLGLATVYGIVKQSGGYIWMYSEPGRGTTFKVYLPRIDAPPEARRRAAPAVTRGSETVLVVEDEAPVRRMTERMLRAAGYGVLSAASGAEALALDDATLARVGLLFTDVVMPGMSGRELANRLLARAPRLRVLFTSGYTDDAIVHHGVLDPGTAFIEKPFTAAQLTRKIRSVLDG